VKGEIVFDIGVRQYVEKDDTLGGDVLIAQT
jgi:hypothetical protein